MIAGNLPFSKREAIFKDPMVSAVAMAGSDRVHGPHGQFLAYSSLRFDGPIQRCVPWIMDHDPVQIFLYFQVRSGTMPHWFDWAFFQVESSWGQSGMDSVGVWADTAGAGL